MRSEDRRQAISRLLRTAGEIEFSEIADRFGVSEMTARRDIEALEQAGVARRVHKGAISTGGRGIEPSLAERQMVAPEGKAAIAARGAELVASGDSIFIDAGTTMVAFAQALARIDREAFVLTPNLFAVPYLTANPLLRVMVLGGLVRTNELSVVGSDAEAMVRRFNVDTAFIGAAGIDLERGITDYGVEETRVKQAAMGQAGRVVLLADESKIGHVGLCRVGDLGEVDLFVTDANSEQLAGFASAGVEVQVVNLQSSARSALT